MTQGGRRRSPELNMRELEEGVDGLVHTREGSDNEINNAEMDMVVPPRRQTTDNKLHK